jgi:hypothetical protein
MRQVLPLPPSRRPASVLRTQAAEYRQMAETAQTIDVVAALLKVADRYETLANKVAKAGRAVSDMH